MASRRSSSCDLEILPRGARVFDHQSHWQLKLQAFDRAFVWHWIPREKKKHKRKRFQQATRYESAARVYHVFGHWPLWILLWLYVYIYIYTNIIKYQLSGIFLSLMCIIYIYIILYNKVIIYKYHQISLLKTAASWKALTKCNQGTTHRALPGDSRPNIVGSTPLEDFTY